MRRAVFTVMWLGLMRDRAALAMSYILPGAVFVIFAVIFEGASGGDLTLRLALADERRDEVSGRLIAGLLRDNKIEQVGDAGQQVAAVRDLVRRGQADVGLIVRATGRPMSELGGPAPSPLEVIGDPAREISLSMLQGALQKAYFSAVPDVAMKGVADIVDERMVMFSPEQKIRLEQGLKALREPKAGSEASAESAGFRVDRLYERSYVIAKTSVPTSVSYYAGGVAIMFLLFSALGGAMTHLEEKESGLLDRVAIGPGGVGVLLQGKFLFLVCQGVLQVTAIYLIAWLGFGVDVPGHLGPWAVTTLLAAVAAGGLALLFVVLCRSKQQAQALGNILILVISALGGSMVPRYLMPGQIQTLGWITPNTWAMEAYGAIFWRAEPLQAMLLPWSALAIAGLGGVALASVIAKRQV